VPAGNAGIGARGEVVHQQLRHVIPMGRAGAMGSERSREM